MKLKNAAVTGTLAVATAVALTACSAGGGDGTGSPTTLDSSHTIVDYSSLAGTLTGGGSSAQANAEAAWTAAFTAQSGGITVNYDKSQGSGGGVTNWLNGSYDFAGSDAPLTAAEQTKSQKTCGSRGGYDLPVYLSGVAIIYNLPGIDDLKLGSATLAKIFTKKITKWNDPAIAAENPGVVLPSRSITTVTRSDSSGTTDNFSTYLRDVQPGIWTTVPSTTWPITGTSAQQGGTGVVNTVESGVGTIGYADQSSIGKAKAADIQVGTSNTFVSYSASGATNAFDAVATNDPSTAGDLTQKLDYSKITETDAYPIPLLSYQIVCSHFTSAHQATLTKAYLGFVASEIGQAVAAKNAGSAPIPASMLAKIQDTLKLID